MPITRGIRGLERGGTYRVGERKAGPPDIDDMNALAILRTFRGKLEHAIEVTGAPDQMFVTIDARPPATDTGPGGTIGGDDLALLPKNLGFVSWALTVGMQMPIVIDVVPREDWRSDTEIARTQESVGRLLERTSSAIETVFARVMTS